jgi:hypothetical protein
VIYRCGYCARVWQCLARLRRDDGLPIWVCHRCCRLMETIDRGGPPIVRDNDTADRLARYRKRGVGWHQAEPET